MFQGNLPQLMAAYNQWQNSQVYAAALQLSDEQRKADRGAYFKSIHRVQYDAATDKEALAGMRLLSESEGIIPALEPSHALGYLLTHRKKLKSTDTVVLCLSGRGDKDVQQVSEVLHLK